MTANANNDKPSWGASLCIFFCLPFASSGKKRRHGFSSDTASKERLSNETLSAGPDQKPTTIVCDGPPATPRPSAALEVMSQKSPSSTATNRMELDGEVLRSKFSPPTPPPKSLARFGIASTSKVYSIPSPIEGTVPTARIQSWPCALNPTNANKSTEFRQSFPLAAPYYPCGTDNSCVIEQNPSSIYQHSEPRAASTDGSTRSRAYSMPVQSVKKHIATLVRVDMMPDSPVHPKSEGDLITSTIVMGAQLYNCSQSLTIPPSPRTPMSFDVSLSKFPLPPSKTLFLEPLAPGNRQSLSFVSHWLYLQTNESFVTIETDISTPLTTKEIIF